MFATSISEGRAALAALAAAVLCLLAGAARADDDPPPDKPAAPGDFVARAEAAFQTAQRKFLADTNNAPAAWEFGRACFDLADLATNNPTKTAIAEKGIAACRQSLAVDPKIAAAHYYLGMTTGQLADTRRNLAGLQMVKEMEREFKTARALDEHFDFAGPDRNLGMLYSQAPPIISIGSRPKARQHLLRGLELAPDYPENHLNLIELYLKMSNRDDAREAFKALEKIWPGAKAKFTGDAWARSWLDWDRRFEAARKKIADTPG